MQPGQIRHTAGVVVPVQPMPPLDAVQLAPGASIKGVVRLHLRSCRCRRRKRNYLLNTRLTKESRLRAGKAHGNGSRTA